MKQRSIFESRVLSVPLAKLKSGKNLSEAEQKAANTVAKIRSNMSDLVKLDGRPCDQNKEMGKVHVSKTYRPWSQIGPRQWEDHKIEFDPVTKSVSCYEFSESTNDDNDIDTSKQATFFIDSQGQERYRITESVVGEVRSDVEVMIDAKGNLVQIGI